MKCSCVLYWFAGGNGGDHNTMNGKGGWSYYNPNAVLKVIGPNLGLPNCVEEEVMKKPLKGEKVPDTMLKDDVPPLCKVVGDGMVQILDPSTYKGSLCHGNCSTKGATCVALDMDAKIGRCLCPNGVILDHLNPQCSNGKKIVLLIQ